MKIAVLLGGTSTERHVSLASGKAVAQALMPKHEVTIYDVALGKNAIVSLEQLGKPSELAPTLDELSNFSNRNILDALSLIPTDTDVAFLALHGAPGEDGTVQSVLELMGIPYTGSGVLSSSIAMDKAMTKRLLENDNIPTPDWFCLDREDATEQELEDFVEQYTGYPVVVKPNTGGSTVGLTIVYDKQNLMQAYKNAGLFSGSVLFEEFIDGRELTVPVLGDEALPAIEIIPKDGFYDYTNKYTAGKTEYVCPANLDEEVTQEAKELALITHEVLGCRAYSRVDFRLDKENVLYCLELNTLPGMTATSLVPKAAAAVGIGFAELCEKIIHLSLLD